MALVDPSGTSSWKCGTSGLATLLNPPRRSSCHIAPSTRRGLTVPSGLLAARHRTRQPVWKLITGPLSPELTWLAGRAWTETRGTEHSQRHSVPSRKYPKVPVTRLPPAFYLLEVSRPSHFQPSLCAISAPRIDCDGRHKSHLTLGTLKCFRHGYAILGD